jgi:hypothetical protein
VSFSELLPTGPGLPPALGLRELTLSALASAILTLREGPGYCADCQPGRPCADHADHWKSLDLADRMEAAYMRIRGIGSDGAMLTLTGGLQ